MSEVARYGFVSPEAQGDGSVTAEFRAKPDGRYVQADAFLSLQKKVGRVAEKVSRIEALARRVRNDHKLQLDRQTEQALTQIMAYCIDMEGSDLACAKPSKEDWLYRSQ